MKQILFLALLCVFVYQAPAQNVQRHIRFHSIDKDSINLSLNEDYNLIEDSCAQIIRYSRFNFQQRKFFGKFTDVSKADPKLIVSEGTYSTDGLKNDQFISYYLNGNLQAKGNFKGNKYDGKWEMYYEDGKPELTFEAVDGDIRLIDVWKTDGQKTVSNGEGVYIDNLGPMYWKGKLVNGKPEGKWNLIKTDDVSENSVATERFKKGQFHDGGNAYVQYTDVSRIELVSPGKLPFVNAERMLVSAVPCNGVKRKHIVGAQYINGLSSFSSRISDVVSPYLGRVDLKDIDNTIDIEGEVSEKGDLINLKDNGSFRQDIARGLIIQLRTLPLLHPATVDGKPVKQKFVISFKIHSGLYSFSYRFLPIQAN